MASKQSVRRGKFLRWEPSIRRMLSTSDLSIAEVAAELRCPVMFVKEVSVSMARGAGQRFSGEGEP